MPTPRLCMDDGIINKMASAILISCSKSKQPTPARAAELYTSPLFRKSLLYALSKNAPYFILSAKYGLLLPDTPVVPYDVTLKTMDVRARDEWGKAVVQKLLPKL